MIKQLKSITIETTEGKFLNCLCKHYTLTDTILTLHNCTILYDSDDIVPTIQEDNIEEFNLILCNLRAFSVDTLK